MNSEEFMARLIEHMPETKDISLITLKGHLLAEEILEQLIREKCVAPDVLINDRSTIGFSTKLRVAQAFDVNPESPVWEVLAALNSLRNKLAHRLEPKKLDSTLERFFDLVERHDTEETSDYKQENMESNDVTTVRLVGSIAQTLGWLSSHLASERTSFLDRISIRDHDNE